MRVHVLARMAVRPSASSLESVFVFMVFIVYRGVRVRHRMMNVKPAVCALLAFRQGHAQGKASPGDKSRAAPAAVRDRLVGRDASQKTLKETTESRRQEADRQAIERCESEGMRYPARATLPSAA